MPIVELASFETDLVWLRWSFDVEVGLAWTGLTDEIWLRRWLGAPRRTPGAHEGRWLLALPHGLDVECHVTHCEPPTRLQATWHPAGESPSQVIVQLTPTAAGCVLTLEHRGVGSLAREHAIGWHAHLIYLAGALRGAPLALDRYWDVYERVARAYVARDRRDAE